MPKPMTVTIDVEEIAFGRVWRTLDAMPGVVKMHMHGTGPKPEAKVRASSKKGETVHCVLLRALKANEDAFPSALIPKKVLEDAVIKAGKAKGSLHNVIDKAKKLKHLRSPKTGFYKITPAGVKYIETVCGANHG